MIKKLNSEDIYKKCDPEIFKFNTSEEVEELGGDHRPGEGLAGPRLRSWHR